MLSETNPEWKEFTDELERTGEKARTNPDGDVGASILWSEPPYLITDRSCLKETRTTRSSFPTVESV